jgi:PPOX class probable F420-dependent enzyme
VRPRARRASTCLSVPSLPNRFYDRIRHPAARSLAGEQRTVSGFDHLQGHKHCLLVTYARSGQPLPTPVWFGLADGKPYVRSDANAAKAKRIRNDPRSRVAPCTSRGKPLGHPPKVGRESSTNKAKTIWQRRRYERTTGSGTGSTKEPAKRSEPRPST